MSELDRSVLSDPTLSVLRRRFSEELDGVASLGSSEEEDSSPGGSATEGKLLYSELGRTGLGGGFSSPALGIGNTEEVAKRPVRVLLG